MPPVCSFIAVFASLFGHFRIGGDDFLHEIEAVAVHLRLSDRLKTCLLIGPAGGNVGFYSGQMNCRAARFAQDGRDSLHHFISQTLAPVCFGNHNSGDFPCLVCLRPAGEGVQLIFRHNGERADNFICARQHI